MNGMDPDIVEHIVKEVVKILIFNNNPAANSRRKVNNDIESNDISRLSSEAKNKIGKVPSQKTQNKIDNGSVSVAEI